MARMKNTDTKHDRLETHILRLCIFCVCCGYASCCSFAVRGRRQPVTPSPYFTGITFNYEGF